MALASFDKLARLPGGTPIQSFPLIQGQLNKGPGDYSGYMIHCVGDGSITINWTDGQTDTITVKSGQDFSFITKTSFTIVSGTFHYV